MFSWKFHVTQNERWKMKILWGAIHINRCDRSRWMRSRSSCLEVLCKKGALNNFEKFTGKYLCRNGYFEEKNSSVKEQLVWLLLELLNGSCILFKHWDRNTFIMLILFCINNVSLWVRGFCLRLSILILGLNLIWDCFLLFHKKWTCLNSQRFCQGQKGI